MLLLFWSLKRNQFPTMGLIKQVLTWCEGGLHGRRERRQVASRHGGACTQTSWPSPPCPGRPRTGRPSGSGQLGPAYGFLPAPDNLHSSQSLRKMFGCLVLWLVFKTWRQEFSRVHLSTGMNTLPISGARFPFWYLHLHGSIWERSKLTTIIICQSFLESEAH